MQRLVKAIVCSDVREPAERSRLPNRTVPADGRSLGGYPSKNPNQLHVRSQYRPRLRLLEAGLNLVQTVRVTKSQARKVIKLCRQAPYGKGAETVVDTDVRRVWELGPDQFRLTNPKWDDFVSSVVVEVQNVFGLGDQKLAPQLYKLLVYEKGSFFLPHRDGEKLDRMVATLVIGLPSVHEGGELMVSHEGRQHEIVFRGAATGHESSYAAFYADCGHAVRPVHSGYRLCLTYNLALARPRRNPRITAPSYGPAVAAIGELLADWSHGEEQKLAVTLEHLYTQDGLTNDTLKGIDRARAEVLFKAAEQADCVAHLALVTLRWNATRTRRADFSPGESSRQFASSSSSSRNRSSCT
jgi:hypothetical protein